MLDELRAKMKKRYEIARANETKFLMSFDIPRLDRKLIILLSVFITLNGLDVLTTLVAINAGPTFVELNPIASGLFELNFIGFIAALSLKYIPVVPLVYVTYLKEVTGRPIAFRTVKVSALVALAAADVFYLIVVSSNLRTLLAFYFG